MCLYSVDFRLTLTFLCILKLYCFFFYLFSFYSWSASLHYRNCFHCRYHYCYFHSLPRVCIFFHLSFVVTIITFFTITFHIPFSEPFYRIFLRFITKFILLLVLYLSIDSSFFATLLAILSFNGSLARSFNALFSSHMICIF